MPKIIESKKVKTHLKSVRVTTELMNRIKKAAQLEKTTESDFIRLAIEHMLSDMVKDNNRSAEVQR